MRNEIISLGGEFRFETQVTDIVLSKDGGVKALVANGAEIPFDIAVLAIGHSARDTLTRTLTSRALKSMRRSLLQSDLGLNIRRS